MPEPTSSSSNNGFATYHPLTIRQQSPPPERPIPTLPLRSSFRPSAASSPIDLPRYNPLANIDRTVPLPNIERTAPQQLQRTPPLTQHQIDALILESRDLIKDLVNRANQIDRLVRNIYFDLETRPSPRARSPYRPDV
jgi:hypothetical protein